MTDDTNPSVVNDDSGSNYNIGSGPSMGDAQMQYLENLQKLAVNMPPKPLPETGYFPAAGQGIDRGTYSSPTTGSVPLFAASNLIPFGMMDEMERSQAEAQAAYLAKLKPYLDKPLMDAHIKLNNVWAQPEFATKVQDFTDGWLNKYTEKLGGNPMMAYIALQHDKTFNKGIEKFGEYANIYNSVAGEAAATLAKAVDKENYCVTDAQVKSITDFIHNHDGLGDVNSKESIDSLAQKANDYQLHDSIYKLADAATKQIAESVTDSAFRKNTMMSTPEETVWEKTITTGTKGQAEDLYSNIVKTQSWLKDPANKEYADLLKSEIDAKVKFGTTHAIEKVKQQDADMTLSLKKMGVDVQDDGSIKFGVTRAALTGGIATYPVNFPNDKPVPSSTSMDGYIMYQGSVHHVQTNQSFPMTLKAEYNTGAEDKNLPTGRKTEVDINFQSTAPYEYQKTVKAGNVNVPIGDPKGQTQTVEATLRDMDTGQELKLMGNQTMLVPAEQLNKTVEANYPGMAYVHQKLEGQLQQRQAYSGMGESVDTPIDIPKGADMSFVKDDPNTYYRNKNGKVVDGATLYDLIRKK